MPAGLLIGPRSQRHALNNVFIFLLVAIALFFSFGRVPFKFKRPKPAPIPPELLLQQHTPTYDYDSHPSTRPSPTPVDCGSLPGAQDVLVLMRTSVSEAHEKLPIHLNTTFRCTPNYALFSDLEEEVEGYPVYDALDIIPEQIRLQQKEFNLYQGLKEYAASGKTDFRPLLRNPTGNPEDAPAYRLDKWKFLPLLDKALMLRPDAKWYVFIEPDTHIVWPNLLHWLAMFNPSRAYYIGAQSWFGGDEFAGTGSGYILSNSAVRRGLEVIASDPTRFTALIDKDCCGDLILAKVLKEGRIRVTRAWPMIQSETPATLDYSAHLWCHPVVSQHHMSPLEQDAMWRFEQEWIFQEVRLPQYPLPKPHSAPFLIPFPHRNEPLLKHEQSPHKPILHRDLFNAFVHPLIKSERQDWDNLSGDRILTESTERLAGVEVNAFKSIDNCRIACKAKPECVQYSYGPGVCNLGFVIRLGGGSGNDPDSSANGLISGWMNGRIEYFKKTMEPCKPRWIVRND